MIVMKWEKKNQNHNIFFYRFKFWVVCLLPISDQNFFRTVAQTNVSEFYEQLIMNTSVRQWWKQ